MIKLIVVWLLAAVFFADSIYVSLFTNFTIGTVLLWLFTALFVAYGIFHRQIDAFCLHGWGRAFKYGFLSGLLIFVLLFGFVAVSGYTNNIKHDEEAIIVLGAGIHGEHVGDVLRRRLDAAITAHNQNPTSLIVVSGGKGSLEQISEALAMQRYLVARGINDNLIITEDKSTSTEENLTFSRELLAQHGIGKDAPIAVVTNAFHCYRAGQYAKDAGFTNVRMLPASMNLWVLLPAYMREVLAVLYRWIFH